MLVSDCCQEGSRETLTVLIALDTTPDVPGVAGNNCVVVGLTVPEAVGITVVLAAALPVETTIAGSNAGLGVASSPHALAATATCSL